MSFPLHSHERIYWSKLLETALFHLEEWAERRAIRGLRGWKVGNEDIWPYVCKVISIANLAIVILLFEGVIYWVFRLSNSWGRPGHGKI